MSRLSGVLFENSEFRVVYTRAREDYDPIVHVERRKTDCLGEPKWDWVNPNKEREYAADLLKQAFKEMAKTDIQQKVEIEGAEGAEGAEGIDLEHELTLRFKVPPWANWYAIDEGGTIFAYAEEPQCKSGVWDNYSDCRKRYEGVRLKGVEMMKWRVPQ